MVLGLTEGLVECATLCVKSEVILLKWVIRMLNNIHFSLILDYICLPKLDISSSIHGRQLMLFWCRLTYETIIQFTVRATLFHDIDSKLWLSTEITPVNNNFAPIVLLGVYHKVRFVRVMLVIIFCFLSCFICTKNTHGSYCIRKNEQAKRLLNTTSHFLISDLLGHLLQGVS